MLTYREHLQSQGGVGMRGGGCEFKMCQRPEISEILLHRHTDDCHNKSIVDVIILDFNGFYFLFKYKE